tara:strand:+ start:3320 stop:4042 length:723 start_codon:yes stop_codon:yes gene_type:complete
MTTIVAIGCSHTYGTLLDGKQSSSLFNLNNSYAGCVAKKHKCKFINLSQPGGSNEFIFRVAIDWLTRYRKRDEDYIVLIGWTSPFRMETRYPEDSEYKHTVVSKIDMKYFPMSLGQGPKVARSRAYQKLHSICPLIFENTKDFDLWATYAYNLQQLFFKNKVKFLMFNTCQELEYTENNKTVIDALDTKYYIHPMKKNENFLERSLGKGFAKTPCWHMKLDAHLDYSLYLSNILVDLDYF